MITWDETDTKYLENAAAIKQTAHPKQAAASSSPAKVSTHPSPAPVTTTSVPAKQLPSLSTAQDRRTLVQRTSQTLMETSADPTSRVKAVVPGGASSSSKTTSNPPRPRPVVAERLSGVCRLEHVDRPHRLMALSRSSWFAEEYGSQYSTMRVHGSISASDVVTFVGTREQCEKAVQKCITYLNGLFEGRVILPPELATLLEKTAKGQAMLKGILSRYRGCGYSIVRGPPGPPSGPDTAYAVCAAENQLDTSQFLDDLNKSLGVLNHDIPLTDLTRDRFQSLVSKLQTDRCVSITVQDAESRRVKTARIHGLVEDVRSTWQALAKFSEEHEIVSRDFEFCADDEKAVKGWHLLRDVMPLLLDHKESRSGETFVLSCVYHHNDADRISSAVAAVRERIQLSVIRMDLCLSCTELEKCLLIHGLKTIGVESLCSSAESFWKDKFSKAVVIIKVPTTKTPLLASSAVLEWSQGAEESKQRSKLVDMIEVLMLDVVEVQADAVVCHVDTDLDLSRSATGAAIANMLQPGAKHATLHVHSKTKPSGPETMEPRQQPAVNQMAPNTFKVMATLTNTRPSCPFKAIFSVVLQQHVDPNIYQKEITKLTIKCLEAAELHDLRSIVFPPLGYGRLFGYNVHVVVLAMISGVLSYLRNNSTGILKKVYFSAKNDEGVACLFLQELHKQCEENGPGKVEAVVYLKNPADKHQAMESLKELVFKQLLHSETVPELSVVRELPDEVKVKLKEWSTDVFFSLDTDSSGQEALKLQGPFTKVQEVKAFIKEEIFQHLKRQREQLQVNLPPYWTLARIGTVRRAHKTVMEKEGKNYMLRNLAHQDRQQLEKVVNRTWKPLEDRPRKDSGGAVATSVKIMEAYRLENPETWEKYAEQKARYLRKLRGDYSCTSIEELKESSGGVFTQLAIGAKGGFLSVDINNEINECYLFHGHPEKEEVKESIAKTGLDPRLSRQGLHGFGIYTAENAAKADSYTGNGPERSMVLARVILGRPCVVKDRQQFSRPPCTACMQITCSCRAPHYDSVLFDSPPLPREFIIYDSTQCYPEYFMTYTTQ